MRLKILRLVDNAAIRMDVIRIWIRQARNFGQSIIPDQLISLIFIMIQIIKNVNATCTANKTPRFTLKMIFIVI